MSKYEFEGNSELSIMAEFGQNRNRGIEGLIQKHFLNSLPPGSTVCEFGAGMGEFIFRFTQQDKKFIAVEIDHNYVNMLSKKVDVYSSLDDFKEELDGIYLIDVLEHIEDDLSMLRKFYARLKKGGRIFIYVPARKELYSSFDERVGHFRRYSLSNLKSIVKEAGFKLEVARYHEFLGYLASGANKLLGKSAMLNPNAVKVYDKYLVPATNILEKIIRIPIGKSIYLAATKE